MVDSHCHLNFHKFEKDVNEVIQNAFNAGLKAIVNVGTSIESSRLAVELTQKDDRIFAIVGIHPHHADKIDSGVDASTLLPRMTDRSWLKELEEIARHPKVIGIGEIGLDYFSYKSNGIVDPKIQKEVFEAQIDLAHRLELPLQIHNRQAGEDVIEILTHHKSLLKKIPGVFHCFAGSHEVLKKALELGFYIGFDGNITYKGLAPGESVELRDIAKLTPIDRILIETDSPYLTPEPLRGSRNEPKNVIIVGEYIANLKNISYKEFDLQIDQNFIDIFGQEI